METSKPLQLDDLKPTIKPFVPEESDFDILIVDDEYINRFLLKDILEQVGYRTHEATNGTEALMAATTRKTDLVLLDIMMPDMNGYEVCKRLKNDAGTANIPVIFVTALTDTENLVKGFGVGAEDYVGKPINEGEVKARVATHLKLKAAVDKIRQYNEELEEVVAESSKELIRSERQAAFGQLIQGIVHNLKGPLTTIRGGAQTCQATLKAIQKEIDKAGSDPERFSEKFPALMQGAAKAAELVDTASRRLSEMINALMSKSSSDQSRKVERLDLNDIIRQELSFLDADLHFKHRIEKKIALSTEPIPIMVNAPEIAQVFSNLISNAIDAMHDRPNPTIAITTAKRNHYAWLEITDNGTGIAPENLSRIFDPFFTTKPKAGGSQNGAASGPMGTGLGLYMCMRSIKALKGDILTESTAGGGTTFRVMLPLALH